MRRVSTGMLLAVWLLPAHGAAQTASLPPSSSPAGASDVFRSGASTYAPRYDRPSPSRQIFTAGGYLTGGPRYVSENDPAPALARYMARGMNSGMRAYDVVPMRHDVVPLVPRAYIDRTFVRTMAYEVASMSAWEPQVQSVYYREYRAYSRSPFLYGVTYVSTSYPHHHHLHYVTHAEPARSPAMFVIPGCFAGDAPPQRPEKLAPGCKLENLRRVYF